MMLYYFSDLGEVPEKLLLKEAASIYVIVSLITGPEVVRLVTRGPGA